MNFDQWRLATRAWLFHFLGQKNAAREAYLESFRQRPSADAARAIGFIAAEQGQRNEAIGWFERTVALAPLDADSWFNLGFVREQQGLRHEAVLAFQEAVRLSPTLDRAWYGLGLVYAGLGQHEEAASALERNIALQPLNAEAWYQLGMAHHHARNPERVREIVVHLRSFDPKFSNKLIRDAERGDLLNLVQTLPF